MIACIGGAHWDRRGVLSVPLVLGTSNPGRIYSGPGGVARNVAQNLARLGLEVMLVSRVGSDESGEQVLRHVSGCGVDTSLCSKSEARATASYTAILESGGELVIGLADMDIYEEVTPAVLEPSLPALSRASLWFVDTNLPAETIEWLLAAAGSLPVAVDGISVAKSRRLAGLLPRISTLFVNLAQASVMSGTRPFSDTHEAAVAMQKLGACAGIVSGGPKPIAVWSGSEVRSFRPLAATPKDVTGAGDALVSGALFGLSRGKPLAEAAQLGLAAAAITVESEHASAPELCAAAMEKRLG